VRAEHASKIVSVAVLVAVENSATGAFRESVQDQFVSWSEWQDLNLIQPIDIAQGGSDNVPDVGAKPGQIERRF
jgi:hypothetical protein